MREGVPTLDQAGGGRRGVPTLDEGGVPTLDKGWEGILILEPGGVLILDGGTYLAQVMPRALCFLCSRRRTFLFLVAPAAEQSDLSSL